jgi:hypothetical protein
MWNPHHLIYRKKTLVKIRRIVIATLLPLALLAWWFIPEAVRTAAPFDIADIGQAFVLDWTQDGDNDGEQLGYAVGAAGDVDGNGYSDIIVGAPTDVYTSDRLGMAYVFHGGAGGLSDSFDPDWTAWGTKGSLFGGAVGTAGDVNNDGYDDVIIGAQAYKNPIVGTGAYGGAFVFYGSYSGLSETPGCDGYDDVIIGASGYSNGEDLEGMIYVFFGASGGLTTTRVFTADSNQANALFGFSVGTAGDVNGDGYDDVLVGAPGYNISGTLNAGATFIFFGAADGISTTHAAIYGDQSDARYGHAVSTAGDVNNDDYSDIVVGAPFYDRDSVVSAGAAFVYLGSPTGVITPPNRQFYGNGIGAQLGAAVGAVGDANNDGYADVIIGAPHAAYGQDDEGAAFIYLGSPSGISINLIWRGEGNKNEATFGFAVGSAGNVDGDSFVDIIIGAPDYKTETYKRGRAFVYRGTGEDVIVYNYNVYLPLVLRASF